MSAAGRLRVYQQYAGDNMEKLSQLAGILGLSIVIFLNYSTIKDKKQKLFLDKGDYIAFRMIIILFLSFLLFIIIPHLFDINSADKTSPLRFIFMTCGFIVFLSIGIGTTCLGYGLCYENIKKTKSIFDQKGQLIRLYLGIKILSYIIGSACIFTFGILIIVQIIVVM